MEPQRNSLHFPLLVKLPLVLHHTKKFQLLEIKLASEQEDDYNAKVAKINDTKVGYFVMCKRDLRSSYSIKVVLKIFIFNTYIAL